VFLAKLWEFGGDFSQLVKRLGKIFFEEFGIARGFIDKEIQEKF